MEYRFGKTDIFSCLTIGLLTWIFLLIISFNLKNDIGALEYVINNKLVTLIVINVGVMTGVYVSYQFGKKRKSFFHFGKFAVIGLSNTLIDLGLLNVMILIFDVHKGGAFALIKAASFVVAVSNSYLWNKLWAFDNVGSEKTGKQFITFLTISCVGLVLNVVCATLVVEYLGRFQGITPETWANVGAISAMGVTVIWNFFGYKYLVFKT